MYRIETFSNYLLLIFSQEKKTDTFKITVSNKIWEFCTRLLVNFSHSGLKILKILTRIYFNIRFRKTLVEIQK